MNEPFLEMSQMYLKTVIFSENFAYVLSEWAPFRNEPNYSKMDKVKYNGDSFKKFWIPDFYQYPLIIAAQNLQVFWNFPVNGFWETT